jgi:hypothetical protein
LKYIGRDTAGNVSTVQTQTYTINAGTVVVSDNFNRADGALTTAVTGQTWNGAAGASVISNQMGYATTASTAYANIDSGHSDNITVEMDLILPTLTTGNISGLAIRMPSAINNQGILWGAKSATKIGFLNTLTGVATAPVDVTFNFVAGQSYHLKAVVSGNVYTCYLDGTLIHTYTDTNSIGLTNTKHGIVIYNTTIPRADNFVVTQL